ncbi:HDIG domain-containing metalloprotein [Clostridium sp.]|uniref:HDIG domain-containing metalloprotein n=1 Tax=Clostridium sp. TaxID=1506 RepID=UPI002635246E|nr:HDIG domain-containing metalloprotein [Clostridium sp.]
MTSLQNLYLKIEEHLINDEKPSNYLNEVYNNKLFKEYPFNMLYKLKEAEQSPKYHPEGNAWNHTMMVADEAAKIKYKSEDGKVFMWAALLHDVGKPLTTKVRNGRITSYDHDKVGERLAKEFLTFFINDNSYIDKICNLVRYHMHILYVVNNLPYKDMKGIKERTNIKEVALLGLCDRLGRLGSNRIKEEETIKIFIELCYK